MIDYESDTKTVIFLRIPEAGSTQYSLHGRIRSSNMSLKDYGSSGISTEMNNGQVRTLAGPAVVP